MSWTSSHPDAKRALAGIGILILVIIFAWFAYYITPIDVEEFTADGTYLGDFQIGTNWYNIFHLIFGTDIDKNWVTTTGLIQYMFLPFVAIVMIMYGIFEEIRFFRYVRWFNPTMAIIIALVVSSSGILVRMMRGYLMIAGGLTIVLFGFILIVGIVLWWIGKTGSLSISLRNVLGEVGKEQSLRIDARRAINQAELAIKTLSMSDDPRKQDKAQRLQAKVLDLYKALGTGNVADINNKLADVISEMRI